MFLIIPQLNQLEAIEDGISGDEIDLSFVDQVEVEIEGILERVRNLDPYDPKVEAFVEVLEDKRSLANNKALVFSTFRHTLAYLAKHLLKAGVRFGLVHGDIKDAERADIRKRFALPGDEADALDVLLSSEVGCEGLDYQFCDFLINYDLPWNPMRVEQRIGRIDRYGQQSGSVAIMNFVTPGTVDADIYERCLMRIGIFQHAVGGSEEILGAVTKEIRNIADRFDLTSEERADLLQQLADNQIRQIREESELEERESQLFGLDIPKQSWENEIENADSFWLTPASIQGTVTSYLNDVLEPRMDYMLGERSLKTLRLSQESRNRLLKDSRPNPRSTEPVVREWERWLKGGVPTLSVTFDQKTASENADTVHLSLLHPLVRQAAQHFDSDEPGFVSVAVEDANQPFGQYPFAIYRWSKRGIKLDQDLIAVCGESTIEESLLPLLEKATNWDSRQIPSSDQIENLESLHYEKWVSERAMHMDENRLFVDQRIQSLAVSHRARRRVLEDQISQATDAKIKLMRESELTRADADFNRKMDELQKATNSAEIMSSSVVYGIISVSAGVDG